MTLGLDGEGEEYSTSIFKIVPFKELEDLTLINRSKSIISAYTVEIFK